MKIIEPGHIYQLEHQDGTGSSMLVFVNREDGTEHEGTQTQEVLRALIDRTVHCDSCLRWPGNDQIIEHLRMALVLHEARALERKTAKGELKPEMVGTSEKSRQCKATLPSSNFGHWTCLRDMDHVGDHLVDRNCRLSLPANWARATALVSSP